MTAVGISEPEGHTKMQWAYTLLCNLIIFTYGLQCGWMSPMTKLLQSEESPTGRPLTDSEISWIASTLSLGGVFGVLLLLQIVDRFGRKPGLMLLTVFQAMVWIIKMLPPSTTTLIIARTISGVAGGGCFHVVPMYLKEISQDNIRGALVSMSSLTQSTAIAIMYAIGGFLDYYTVLWSVLAVPILTLLLFLKAPESPSFLVKKGKIEEAAATLALLRGLDADDKEIQTEVSAIKKNDEYFKTVPEISMATILKTKEWKKALFIMILVILTHATSGAFSVLSYAAALLSDSGIQISPEIQSLSIPICMACGSLVTITCVDKLGRKPILGTAFAVTAIAFGCLATSIVLKRHGWYTPGWIDIVMMMVSVFCYGGGVGPIPIILIAEIFNFQIRAKLVGFLVMLAWLVTFVQLIAFNELTSHFGAHVGFYMFVVIDVLGAIVAVFILPETKGKSTEEIESELRGKKKINENKC